MSILFVFEWSYKSCSKLSIGIWPEVQKGEISQFERNFRGCKKKGFSHDPENECYVFINLRKMNCFYSKHIHNMLKYWFEF